MIDLPELRWASLLLAMAIWVVALAGAWVAHKMNSRAHPVLAYGMTAVVGLATLRLYSASSFLWGSSMPDDLWWVPRTVVLALSTGILIVLLALVAYYWRRRT